RLCHAGRHRGAGVVPARVCLVARSAVERPVQRLWRRAEPSHGRIDPARVLARLAQTACEGTIEMATIQDATRGDIEEFLFHEAELLDNWELTAWRELFVQDCLYVVPNLALPGDAPVRDILHLVVDDGHHLTE